jgi:copper homeostasis protein
MRFEICVDSVDGVAAAHAAGAARVELCASLIEGGITPSAGTIMGARRVEGIGLHVIIRPRGGDFAYGPAEIATMLDDIAVAKTVGADGVVIGALTPDGAVDVSTVAALVRAARPLKVTFHRAFDMARDPEAALDALIDLGIDRVLTSGQAPTAFEGAETIAAMVRRAEGRIIVMAGGGITPRNAARVAALTGVEEMHFAALSPDESPMGFRRADVYMGGELRPPEFQRLVTTTAGIRAVIDAVS